MKLSLLFLACAATLLLAGCATTDSAQAKDSSDHNTVQTQRAGEVANTANAQQADNNAATDDSTPQKEGQVEDANSTDRRANARRSLGMGH